MMKLYVVRHGQTLFNVKGQIQGWCDSPLTALGIEQAKKAGKGLSNIDFVAGYSSTAERAKDTLDYLLGDRDVPRFHVKGLREIFVGDLEGEEESAYAKAGLDYFDGFTSVGGESFPEAVERFTSTLKEIAKKHPEGNVLIATHGGVIMGTLMAMDPKWETYFRTQGGMKNCAVTVFCVEDGILSVESANDTSYVGD